MVLWCVCEQSALFYVLSLALVMAPACCWFVDLATPCDENVAWNCKFSIENWVILN